jgi:hypothetical protein
MRVCQFRHYGTVSFAPHRWPEHANREPLVFQTPSLLSMFARARRGVCGMAVPRANEKRQTFRATDRDFCSKMAFTHEEGYISPT